MNDRKTQLDLGCGNTVRGEDGYDCYGVDIIDSPNPKVKQADLAISPIPYDSNSFDLVTAHDFLEHIPNFVYIDNVKVNSMINIFNEVYRILKVGGIFKFSSPCYPDQSAFQDPTHVFVFTTETPNYFSGDYYGFHDHYGHTSRFELVSKEVNFNHHLIVELRARKDIAHNEPYILEYLPYE
jgi:SAM-dependent methyltransferase